MLLPLHLMNLLETGPAEDQGAFSALATLGATFSAQASALGSFTAGIAAGITDAGQSDVDGLMTSGLSLTATFEGQDSADISTVFPPPARTFRVH